MAVTPCFENVLFFPLHLQVLITHSWINSILQWRHCRRSQRPQSFLMSRFFALSRHFKRSFQFQVVGCTNTSVFIYVTRQWTQLYVHLKVFLQPVASIHSSMALQPLLGPGPPSEDASIILFFLMVSTILVFLGSVICPSGRRPPILFLVFPLVLYYEISHYEPFFWDPFIFRSYNMTCPS